jgi:DNA-binding transcriptional LysR family regulator
VVPTSPRPFRIAIVPGVNPGKWTRAWTERRRTPVEVKPIEVDDQRAVLDQDLADVAFVRLPIVRDDLSVIRLYEELAVVVVPRDHPVSLFDTVTLADLDGETVRQEPLEDAIDLVVAGVGVLVIPQSIARQHARRDLVMRPITDAPVTEIAIAWLTEATSPEIEEFVGIVRGRTASSSRGVTEQPEPSQKTPARKPAQNRAAQNKAAQKKPAQKRQPPRPRRTR